MNWFFRLLSGQPKPVPATFNERVAAFWQWFAGVADRFHGTIDSGSCAALTEETSSKINEFFPGFAWVFGPGENGTGHSLTLTGEGDIHRQLLTQHWLAQAPTLPGWSFYASRQPGRIKGKVIELDGIRFDPKEIWVTPSIDAERECIDITVWHPLWEKLPEGARATITFLFLDESLGEYGTGWWIGTISYGKDQLAGSFPLEELAEYAGAQQRDRGWKKYPPGQSLVLYSTKNSPRDFPRADVLTQTTAVPKLFLEYMNLSGEYPDPFAGFGADYIYVSIDPAFFPAGQEVAKRGEVEDAIEQALLAHHAGRGIGGALGRERCYADFLIFDGARSLDLVRQTLLRLQVPPGTMIEYFAREKRSQRIAL